MKKRMHVTRTKVPECRCVSRDSFSDTVVRASCNAFGTNTFSSFADSQAQTIRAPKIMMMAGPARNVSISGQYLVVKKQLTNARFVGFE